MLQSKIKKLLDKAEVYYNDDMYSDYNDLASLQKFAELIVAECVAQCDKNKDHEWLGAGSKVSAFNIKQHFGVEE